MRNIWIGFVSVAVTVFLVGFAVGFFGNIEELNADNDTTDLKSASLPYSQAEKYSIAFAGQFKAHIIEFSDKKHHHCVIAIGPSGSTSITCEGH